MLNEVRNQVRADAVRNPMRDSVELFFFWRDAGGKRNFVKDLIIQNLDEAEIPPESPLMIGMDTAQQLIDALWRCGLRPTEGSGSAGSLLATQNHLKDLQKFSDRLLAMVEKGK